MVSSGNTESNIRAIILSKGKIAAFLTIGLVLFITLVVTGVYFFSGIVYKTKISRIKKDNDQLISSIYDIQNRMKLMESEVRVLAEKDKALRTYVDIPAIDVDIRKLGIGGKIVNKSTELDNLLPIDDVYISELSQNLDKLSRELKLELISYDVIYDAVKHHSSQILSTPSIRPVNIGYISDGFGYRRDPFTRERQFHYGIDISAPSGTPIYATADGVISNVNYHSSGFGKRIIIDHGFGFSTLYGHLSKIHVKNGEVIKRGQLIGEVGSSGRSTAPHLHYGVTRYGKSMDPLDYFFTENTP